MIVEKHAAAAPLLSITMPTRNRPGLSERALGSVLHAMAPVAEHVEITVSDGSSDEATGQVVQRLLTGWPGGHRYVRNQPALELTANMNRAVELARGAWVQQLDDDDYLLPGAGMAMINAIRAVGPDEAVLVFGAEIVDAAGLRQREQRFLRERYLTPRQALRAGGCNNTVFERVSPRDPGLVPFKSRRRAAGAWPPPPLLRPPHRGAGQGLLRPPHHRLAAGRAAACRLPAGLLRQRRPRRPGRSPAPGCTCRGGAGTSAPTGGTSAGCPPDTPPSGQRHRSRSWCSRGWPGSC